LRDLALQLFDQFCQLSHRRLLMKTRATFERGFKTAGFQGCALHLKGLHHLWWQVWKRADIEGLRHAPS